MTDDDQTFTVTVPRGFVGRIKLIIDVDPEDEDDFPPTPPAPEGDAA